MTASSIGLTSSSADRELFEAQTYAKVTARLLPFLFICYVAAYLDRVNVGFAKLQMLSELQFSETIYGIGAGIFFIGYFFFEVPSNIILHRVGARAWIARIMITWAILSAATAFVTTPFQFYVVRFFLGVAEAGFFPGIVLYLTYWFPAKRRSRMNALFMIGIPVAGVIGGPLSGWIMRVFHGMSGYTGWQWLFIIEAIPSIILGIATLFLLPNSIRASKWLKEDEKRILEENIAQENSGKENHSLSQVFGNAKVWLMAAIYFCCMMGLYGVGFYLPTLIKAAGVKDALDVGFLTAIPYGCAVAAMLLIAKSADHRRERRWHFAIPSALGGLGLFFSTIYGDQILMAMIALSVATAGILATMPVFWSYPSAILSGTAAAAGIAMINSIGNLAGFVSPSIIGWMKDVTDSTNSGVYLVSAALIIGAVLSFLQPASVVNK
jgi:D-galactonate transporter